MNSEKRSKLLDILEQRVELGELRSFVYRLFGKGEYNNLDGTVHSDKCIAFLERIESQQKEQDFLQLLSTKRPDIDLSSFEILSEAVSAPPQESESTPYIEFVNRKTEWEHVVLYPEGQYYLFDAPAGYGKTRLLEKVQEEFTRREWRCGCISIEKYPRFSDIARRLGEILEIEFRIYANPYRTGWALGKALIQQSCNQGVALLFDLDHTPSKAMQSTLKALLSDFIPGVWEALTGGSEFFRDVPANYRIVLAGRYLPSAIDNMAPPYKFQPVQLTPFKYPVVQEMCVNYLRGRLSGQEEWSEFSAHLLFYSGGHPNAISRMLQLYDQLSEECQLSAVEFFTQYREDVEHIAYDEASQVRNSIRQTWRRAFDTLCIYRRFDRDLVRKLTEQDIAWQALGKDAHDVIIRLLRLYLVDWRVDSAFKHLGDDITRRLLAIRLYYDASPREFTDTCTQATQFCLNHLTAPGELRHVWAIEALFSCLQSNIPHINTLEDRQALRQEFFRTQLPQVFALLVKDQDPHFECEALKHLLAKDWEFRFTTNYYLRGERYTDEAYQELVRYVEKFPSTEAR